MGKSKDGYTLSQEKDFINGLGNWSLISTTRIQLLIRYRKALSNRFDFGGINRQRLFGYVNRAIQIEQDKGA